MRVLRVFVLVLLGTGSVLGGSVTQQGYTVCPQGPPTCPFKKIAEAIAAAEPGSVITIGPGTYTERFTIEKPLTLQGAGRTLTILRVSRQDFAVTLQGTAQVVLEGLRFEGRRQQYEGSGKAVKVSDQAHLIAREVAFAKGERAILIDNQATATIQNTVISEYDLGIAAGGTSRLVLSHSALTANRTSISIYTSAQGVVEHSELLGGVIEIDGDAQLTLQKNRLAFAPTFEGSEVRLLNRSRAQIRENEITLFTISVGRTAHLLLEKNAIRKSKLYFGGSSSGLVHDNTITHAEYSGIYITSNGVVEIRSNQIMYNQTGIDVSVYDRLSSQLVKIESNVIAHNERCGIEVLDGQADGSNNEMHDNGMDLCYRAPARLRRPLVPQTDKDLVRVPDDYRSIQEAIDAVAPGGTVEIAPGRYETNLLLYKPVHLHGTGSTPDETIIIPRFVTYGIPMIMALTEAERFGFNNLTLSLDKKNQGLVRVYGSAQASIRNVIVRGGSIVLWDESQAQIAESIFEGNGNIDLFDRASAHLLRSHFIQGQEPSTFIYLRNRSTLTLHESILEGHGEGGAVTLVDQAEAQIERSIFRKLFSTLFLREYSKVTLRENIFAEIKGAGLELGTFDEDRVIALAERNTIEASQGPGIVVKHIQAVLRENTVTNNTGDGILLVGLAEAEIVGNRITQNNGWGIAVWSEQCQDPKQVRDAPKENLFRGTVTGSDNELKDNKKGDLCGVPESLKKP